MIVFYYTHAMEYIFITHFLDYILLFFLDVWYCPSVHVCNGNCILVLLQIEMFKMCAKIFYALHFHAHGHMV
jgi:hypothetical protein